jgi:hypothetical protein
MPVLRDNTICIHRHIVTINLNEFLSILLALTLCVPVNRTEGRHLLVFPSRLGLCSADWNGADSELKTSVHRLFHFTHNPIMWKLTNPEMTFQFYSLEPNWNKDAKREATLNILSWMVTICIRYFNSQQVCILYLWVLCNSHCKQRLFP